VSNVGSNLGTQWPSLDCPMEVVRSLAREFLAKIRAEVDRIIFFGLGLKVDASSDIRRSMGRVLSWLGLKPKLLFGDKWREGEAQGSWAVCEAQALDYCRSIKIKRRVVGDEVLASG
jgi:hypothetical protein